MIGPADPAVQLEICARLGSAADAASCVRGTKVQNLLEAPIPRYVRLIDGCGRFGADSRAACYRWMGKALAVVTDGRFERAGCPKLRTRTHDANAGAGGRSMEGALETFS